MTHQTNAQRLADVLDHFGASGSASKEAATELRRLSAIATTKPVPMTEDDS